MPIEIRPAEPYEYPAGRMLMPGFYRQRNLPPSSLILATNAVNELLGATVFAPVSFAGTVASYTFDLHVRPKYRRQGIGTGLLETLCSQLARYGVEQLCYWQRIDTHHDQARADYLSRHGFEHTREVIEFHLNERPQTSRLAALLEAAGEYKLMPDDVVLRDMCVADADPVRQLHEKAGLQGSMDKILIMDAGELVLRPNDCSIVISRGDIVKGALTAFVDEGVMCIETVVVDREQPLMAAYPMLIERSVAVGHSAGIHEVRFYCDSRAGDIVKLARRFQAREARRMQDYQRPLMSLSK